MWLPEKIRKLNTKKASALIFLGVLVLLFAAIEGKYLWKNVQVFFYRSTDEATMGAPPEEKGEPNMLSIPSLEISAPVLYINEKGEDAYQAALAHGVVHYPGTALPGASGNVYIFGHSSDLPWSTGSYKTVFASLPQIAVGDDIYLTDSEGTTYVYDVTETKVVGPKDLSVLDQFENKEKLLTLQTSYPLGTALKRFIVIAKLQEN